MEVGVKGAPDEQQGNGRCRLQVIARKTSILDRHRQYVIRSAPINCSEQGRIALAQGKQSIAVAACLALGGVIGRQYCQSSRAGSMPQPAKEESRLDIMRKGEDFDRGQTPLDRCGEPPEVRPVEPHPPDLGGSDLVEGRGNAGRADPIDLATQRPQRTSKARWRY